MRLNLKSNKVISVLGLPHSGTTIACNTFNSMKNGFCLSEPHWILLSNPGQLTFDKLIHFKFNGIDDLMSGVKRRVESDSFLFGGVKETYRPQDPKMLKYLNHVIDNSDIIVAVFREPKALFESFIRLAKSMNRNSYMPVERLIYDYNHYFNKIKSLNKPVVKLTLEQFCDAGSSGVLSYINSRSEAFKAEGNYVVNKTNYRYGNASANTSARLKPSNKSFSLLSSDEVKVIDRELKDKYLSIKNK
jgi:hypothetical protein